MKKLPTLIMLLGVGAFAIVGCQEPVEDEVEDVAEARGDVQEEKVEGLNEIEGEATEANQEIADEREELREEKEELSEAIDKQTTVPAETTTNVEGDTDAIEEVEPQN